MKHDRFATGSALAVTVGAFYILCRVFVWLFPELSLAIARSMFHGMQVTTPQMMALYTPGSFVLGLAVSMTAAFFVGWCFAHCYNMFSKKK